MGDISHGISPCSSSGSSSSSSPNPNILTIDGELWLMAEERIQEILWTIQPNVLSEWRRRGLISYVQRLIKGCFGTEVFSFGSVPLKGYLPDGDIDLTAVCHQTVEEDLARAVCDALESQSKDSCFQIKDVRYVPAQVKVVKCTVNDMAVDISFNQMAGLCTLCFLEQVDQLIGKDHLFKKSIILIKAWCYYESRILGAHYGLISTYAIETLVLFIINLFHSSVRGPLEVLHRFLEYYSTFDWDNYCISINGPVAISSLPEIIVTPQNEGEELLLSEEFVKECKTVFSDPTRGNEARAHEFPTKHLNILDPLKDDNNLGRSVSKGNFYRIKSALSLGAEKLRGIFMLPGEIMGMELEKFFVSTLDRNGSGQRPDVLTPVPAFGTGTYEESNLSGDYKSCFGSLVYGQAFHVCTHPSAPPYEVLKWTSLVLSAHLNWNVFCERAANMHPRLPIRHRNTSQPSAATVGVGVIKKSQGTGTFIPDMTQNYSRYACPRVRGRIPESRTHCAMMKAPQKTDQVEVPSEAGTSGNAEVHPEAGTSGNAEVPPEVGTKGNAEVPPEVGMSGNVSRFNLTAEEFPLLPGPQRPPSPEVYQFDQLVLASPPVQESSHTFNIKLGSSGHSPSLSGIPSPLASQQANTRASYVQNLLPRVGMQKQQELSEVIQESIRLQQFKLDNEEFPPLNM